MTYQTYSPFTSFNSPAKAKNLPIDVTTGMKPYDLWKSNLVANTDKSILGANHNIKLVYDQSSKAYLTTAKGQPNQVDYISQAKVFHGNKDLKSKAEHIELD
jgi:hypothetical protein